MTQLLISSFIFYGSITSNKYKVNIQMNDAISIMLFQYFRSFFITENNIKPGAPESIILKSFQYLYTVTILTPTLKTRNNMVTRKSPGSKPETIWIHKRRNKLIHFLVACYVSIPMHPLVCYHPETKIAFSHRNKSCIFIKWLITFL